MTTTAKAGWELEEEASDLDAMMSLGGLSSPTDESLVDFLRANVDAMGDAALEACPGLADEEADRLRETYGRQLVRAIDALAAHAREGRAAAAREDYAREDLELDGPGDGKEGPCKDRT